MFGSLKNKKKIVVDSSSSRVIDDAMISSFNDAVIADVLFNQRDYSDALLEAITNSAYGRFRKFQSYGGQGYSRGLPTAVVDSNSINLPSIQHVLDTINGSPVTVDYAYYDLLNPYHVAWKVLAEQYGYSEATGTLVDLEDTYGAPVFVSDLKILYPASLQEEMATATHFTNSRTTRGLRRAADPVPQLYDEIRMEQRDVEELTVEVTLTYEQANTGRAGTHVEEFTLDITMGDYDREATYYQVRYDTEDTTVYWLYDPETDQYPSLDGSDTAEASYVNAGRYFPIVLFRSEGEDLTAESLRDSSDYKTSQTIMRTLGLNYQDLADSINENEDINMVEQAAMMVAIPITSDDPIDMGYLFHFFDGFYSRVLEHDESVDYAGNAYTRKYMINFQEGDDFTFGIGFDGISKRTVAGVIGAKGTFTNETDRVQVGREGTNRTATVNVYVDQRVLRYQITDNLYQEIRVNKPYKRQVIYRNRSEVADFEDDECLIPLDMDLLTFFNQSDRSELVQRALRLVFNTQDTYYVRWYQSSAFRIILVIAAIVITAMSGGTASGPVATALAALGITGLALTILTIIIQGLLIQVAVKVVARQVNPRFAFVLAIVAAISAFGADSEGFLTASNMLQASNGLAQVSTMASQYAMLDLQDDYAAEMERQEDLNEDLDRVKDFIAPNFSIDPFMFTGFSAEPVLGETAEDYFSRTIHAGNIGTYGFDYIHNYHDMNLQLPDPQDFF